MEPLRSTHSHDERRTVAVFDPEGKLADTDRQPHVAAIIRVERDVHIRNAQTGLLRHSAETVFYVANMPVTAARAAETVRAHWKIRIPPVTAGTPPWARTVRASAPTPACLPACAALPSTS